MRISKRLRRFAATACLVLLSALCTFVTGAAEAEKKPVAPMTNAYLEELIRRIDPQVQGRLGLWQLTIEQRTVLVITDEKANRMRIMTEVASADQLDPKKMYRLLQANFDSALDARYSIARNVLWSTFIRPLSTLRDDEFLAGLGQVVNLAQTYGTSYSSGLLIFQGGDSNELQRHELIKRLLKKGLET